MFHATGFLRKLAVAPKRLSCFFSMGNVMQQLGVTRGVPISFVAGSIGACPNAHDLLVAKPQRMASRVPL